MGRPAWDGPGRCFCRPPCMKCTEWAAYIVAAACSTRAKFGGLAAAFKVFAKIGPATFLPAFVKYSAHLLTILDRLGTPSRQLRIETWLAEGRDRLRVRTPWEMGFVS